MKLEAVRSRKPAEICAATVTKLVCHLVWLHMDSQPLEAQVDSVRSLQLFPCGWAVSNGFQLRPPGRVNGAGSARKRIAVVQPE